VIVREEQRAIDVGEPIWVGTAAAGSDVLDQNGARLGAVALPQLAPIRAVVGREKQRAVYISQHVWARAEGTRPDILDEGGAGGGAVAPPQLPPVCGVGGLEEQRPVHVRQQSRVRAIEMVAAVLVRGAARVEVGDEGGAGGRAVALPQFP